MRPTNGRLWDGDCECCSHTRNKGLPKGMSEALKKGADESTLFQRLKESQPSLEPIGRVTRAKFCCEQHDRVFNSIDS